MATNKLPEWEYYHSDAFKEGSAAARMSGADCHSNQEDYVNPYPQGSEEWTWWNLGWNSELMRQP